jgi:hypothetical protein
MVASGLPGIDDFAFTGAGDTLIAVQNQLSQADLTTPHGAARIVLTAADGLSTPSVVAGARPCRVRDQRRLLHRRGPEPADGPPRPLSPLGISPGFGEAD